jgi:hypothetical protein
MYSNEQIGAMLLFSKMLDEYGDVSSDPPAIEVERHGSPERARARKSSALGWFGRGRRALPQEASILR